MASLTATGSALAQLAAIYRRELTPQVYTIYGASLSDVDDSTLQIAVERCLRTCKFFPTPAELRDAVGANAEPTVDPEAIVLAIQSLGTWNSRSGVKYPSGARVRDVFGDGIAAAYIDAGAAKLFGDDEKGRDISHRDFRQNLKHAMSGPRGQEIAQRCEAGLVAAALISARLTAVLHGQVSPALSAGDQSPRALPTTAHGHRGAFRRLSSGSPEIRLSGTLGDAELYLRLPSGQRGRDDS